MSDAHDLFFELFATDKCGISHLDTVVVNRGDGAPEKFGNFHRVVDAEPDQCEDSQFGSEEHLTRDGFDAFVGLEKLVELSHEVGEEMQKRGIEFGVEFVELRLDECR